MGSLEKNIATLLTVGDVGFYKTYDGDYGVSLDFYDKSYYLAHPAKSIKDAASQMLNEWRVQDALKHPERYEAAFRETLNMDGE